LQKILFDRYGVLYERKRGEFVDGVNQNYIQNNQVLERNLFFRIYYATIGKIDRSINRKVLIKHDITEKDLTLENLDNFYFGFLCFNKFYTGKNKINIKKDRSVFSQIYIFTKKFKPSNVEKYHSAITENTEKFNQEWSDFLNYQVMNNRKHVFTYFDKENKKSVTAFSQMKWFRSKDFEKDVLNYFKDK